MAGRYNSTRQAQKVLLVFGADHAFLLGRGAFSGAAYFQADFLLFICRAGARPADILTGADVRDGDGDVRHPALQLVGV